MYYNKKIFKRCFNYSKKYWYKNFKYIPLYIKQMNFLIKNGYDPYATWETFDWFINTFSDILIKYKKNKNSYPELIQGKTEDESLKLWNNILDSMIISLEDMDESNPKYNNMTFKEEHEKRTKAKKDFFELFERYFYYLWD